MIRKKRLIQVVPIVPVVKDQSRVVGSANLPCGNTAVSTASMITGEDQLFPSCQRIHTALHHSQSFLVIYEYSKQFLTRVSRKLNGILFECLP